MVLLFGMIGPWQLVLIFFAVLLLFGGKKIPQLMKGIGQGISEYKNATKKIKNDSENEN